MKITDGNDDVILITKNGMSIRFHETDVRTTGRVSMGVIGMNLDEDDEWEITAESDEQTYFDLEYQFVKYERKK